MLYGKVAILFTLNFAIGCADNYRIYQINDKDAYRNSQKYAIKSSHYQKSLQGSAQIDAGTGMRNLKYRWPTVGKKIIVPFIIDLSSRYTRLQIEKIYAAMRHISDRTCINFKWRSVEKDYLLIYSGKWCTSYVGRMGNAQRVSLQRSATCANHIATIIHELVHALGFFHMQSHPFRDQYISVFNENISEGEVHEFQKIDSFEATNFDTPFDYFSIMHYGTHAFSKNGKPTILTKHSSWNKIIGQNNKLSVGDVARIRNMYKCKCIENGWNYC